MTLTQLSYSSSALTLPQRGDIVGTHQVSTLAGLRAPGRLAGGCQGGSGQPQHKQASGNFWHLPLPVESLTLCTVTVLHDTLFTSCFFLGQMPAVLTKKSNPALIPAVPFISLQVPRLALPCIPQNSVVSEMASQLPTSESKPLQTPDCRAGYVFRTSLRLLLT